MSVHDMIETEREGKKRNRDREKESKMFVRMSQKQ